MAYTATYDGGLTRTMSRSMSRRPSMGYAVSAPAAYSHGGYVEPGMESYSLSYPLYAPQPSTAVVPLSRRLTGPWYDDINDYGDTPYYDDMTGGYSRPVTPHTLTPHPPHTMVTIPPQPIRHRRNSAVSFVSPTHGRDAYAHYRHGGRPGSLNIKFKRKGAFMAGIGLDEAQSHIRLSNNDAYSIHDLHADPRGRILLKVKWVGYSSLTYEIPLDAYDGRVNLSTLARRVSRACVHYLQANVIPILWDRVELHHLEEVSYGVWQPMLSTR
ncbi:hypothetical protein AN958_07960 [Leucoagaricus sp. SymC.cos]|nr:hypothetical protein AN958_07960 [Leucoagaricus sp. SymC.cos]